MARNENNWPLLGELLEVYLRIPVTVALLKQNTAAKTIKKMQGKTEDDRKDPNLRAGYRLSTFRRNSLSA